MAGFALAGICEPIGPARCEGVSPVGQVEFRRPSSRPWAEEPPPSAAEGLGRGLKLDPVIRLSPLPVPSGGRVSEPQTSGFLAEKRVVADRSALLAGPGVCPRDRPTPRASGPIARQGR